MSFAREGARDDAAGISRLCFGVPAASSFWGVKSDLMREAAACNDVRIEPQAYTMNDDSSQNRVHPGLPMAYVCSVITRRPGETVMDFKERASQEMWVVGEFTAAEGLAAGLPPRLFIARCALTSDGLTNSSFWGKMYPELPAEQCVIALIPSGGDAAFGYDANALADAPRDASPADVQRFMTRYAPTPDEAPVSERQGG